VKVLFRKSFSDDLSSIHNRDLLLRIKNVIEKVEDAKSFHEISNLKRLQHQGKCYRIRVGDFRLGFVFENGAVTFVRCLDRKKIYRYFP